MFEPAEVPSRYVVEPNFHRGWGEEAAKKNGFAGGKQAALEWDAKNKRPGISIVTEDMLTRANGMRDAILADPVAGPGDVVRCAVDLRATVGVTRVCA